MDFLRRIFSAALAVATVLTVCSLPASARAGTIATDPRCAGYTCTLDRNTPSYTFTSDPTTCSNSTNCPRCLVGPEWDARIAALGAKSPRAFQPTLIVNNWLSAEINDNVAAILLRDVLGFEPNLAAVPIDGTMDTICCTTPVFELEKWPSGRFPNDDGYFTVSALPAGYEGGSGLFVPGYVLDRYPLATSYSAYRVLPDYANVFPRGMSADCSLLIKDPALGCVDGNYWCDDNTWSNTTCTRGRYVPPQCQLDPTRCQEIFLANPTWDTARFEALIKNTGLPFIAAYLGGSGMPTYVKAAAARRENVMFYWWEPDPLPSSLDAKIVNFPPSSYECEVKHQAGQGDPTLSRFDCAYPRALMLKIGRRSDLARDASFKHFFDSFTLTGSDMGTMLAQHRDAGGNGTSYSVACSWAKDNMAAWQAWMRAAPTEAPGVAAAATAVLVPAIAVPVALLAALAAVAAVVVRVRAQAAVKNAPKKAPMALVFTDVESSTKLWETYGADMAVAMDTHHEVVRRCIETHECYEVKTIGDAFMVACPSVLDATLLAFDIQTALHDAEWPAALVDWKGTGGGTEHGSPAKTAAPNWVASDPNEADPHCVPALKDTPPAPATGGEAYRRRSETLVSLHDASKPTGFRGLNVRMGIHLCVEVEPKFDVIHKRYDYYGHDVNMSARVQSAAQGGQILCTEETLHALQNDTDFAAALGDDCAVTFASRAFELKGVAEPVALYSILPAALAMRRFEALPNAPTGLAASADMFAASLGAPSSVGSIAAASEHSAGGAGSTARNLALGAERLLGELEKEKPEVAEAAVAALCKRFGIANRGALPKRMRMVVKAIGRTAADADGTASTDHQLALSGGSSARPPLE